MHVAMTVVTRATPIEAGASAFQDTSSPTQFFNLNLCVGIYLAASRTCNLLIDARTSKQFVEVGLVHYGCDKQPSGNEGK